MAIIDKERSRNLYNAESYQSNTNNWEDEVSLYRASAFVEALEKAEIIDKIDSILDVGSGSGGVLAEISADGRLKNTRLEGLDISDTAVKIANSLAVKKGVVDKVKYSKGSISEIDLAHKYTVVSLIHVMEHCPDMLEMLEECASRSEYQYINVPLEYNLFYSLRGSVPERQFEKYGHLHFFDEPFFLKWLDSNGYDLIANVYSKDFLVKKSGIAYKIFQVLRSVSLRILGPRLTIRFLAGISGGYLTKKR